MENAIHEIRQNQLGFGEHIFANECRLAKRYFLVEAELIRFVIEARCKDGA